MLPVCQKVLLSISSNNNFWLSRLAIQVFCQSPPPPSRSRRLFMALFDLGISSHVLYTYLTLFNA
ncbi:unnamed protein product [Absidia cylindrospora]